MRVYYDFQVFAGQRYGGISRYFFELATRIRSMGVDARVGCLRSLNWYFREELGMYTYSKCRIIRGIDPAKIAVVHLGASMPAVDGSLPSPVEGDYVLFVGNRGGYKNFLRFVEAMRPVLEARKDLCVFCIGGEIHSK